MSVYVRLVGQGGDVGCLYVLSCVSMRVTGAGIRVDVWAVRGVGRRWAVCHICRMSWFKDQAPLGGGREDQSEEHGF